MRLKLFFLAVKAAKYFCVYGDTYDWLQQAEDFERKANEWKLH